MVKYNSTIFKNYLLKVMSNVSFQEEEDWEQYGQVPVSQNNSKLIDFLMKNGLAKNSIQANYFLIGAAILVAIVSIYIFVKALPPSRVSSGAVPPAVAPGEVLPNENLPPVSEQDTFQEEF